MFRLRPLPFVGTLTALVAALTLAPTGASASPITLNATAQGTVSSTGGGCGCYPVGFDSGGAREFRAFFGFDLSSLAGETIDSATLKVLEPSSPGGGYSSSTSSVVLYIGGYSNSAGNPAGASFAAFSALGNGTVFGTATTTAADDGSQVQIALNAAGLSAIQSAESAGGTFYFGAYTPGLAGTNNSIFQWSGYVGPGAVQLTVDASPAPEPASLAIIGIGLAGLGWIRRRPGPAQVVRSV